MSDWIRQNRILLGLNAGVLLCVGIAWLSYAIVGHRIIEAIYGGPWIEFLHKAMMMEGQSILPLDHYFRAAEKLMWSATFAAALVVSSAILIVKSPPNITRSVLCFIFVIFGLSVSAIAFLYPLEIETRESTVWLHVLALRHGINIYDHSQVAFINQNHGPFDPLFKLWIAALFPFLESWQVTRISVLLLPYAFLLVAWKWISKQSRSLLDALYLGSIGYLFLIVSAKEFIFVGRSDATAALLLLPLIYFSFALAPTTLAEQRSDRGPLGCARNLCDINQLADVACRICAISVHFVDAALQARSKIAEHRYLHCGLCLLNGGHFSVSVVLLVRFRSSALLQTFLRDLYCSIWAWTPNLRPCFAYLVFWLPAQPYGQSG